MEKRYLTYDFIAGYPAAAGLFYECQICLDVLPSLPSDNTACKCGNITIDVDAGRLSVDSNDKIKLFQTD